MPPEFRDQATSDKGGNEMWKCFSADKPPRNGKKRRLFLQPLAVGVVCGILTSLLLLMGLMDLRALDRTLVGYFENRGQDIIRNVQQVAERGFQQLMKTGSYKPDSKVFLPFTEEAFFLREALVHDLIGLGQEIDIRLKDGSLSQKELSSLTSEEGLWLVALLNDQGIITFRTRPVPKGILRSARPVTQGRTGIKVNIFDDAQGNNKVRSIVFRRKSGKGAIVLAMDNKGFRYRCLRVSVQTAINELGYVPGVVSLMVMSHGDRVLGLAGELSGICKEEGGTGNAFQARAGVISRKIDWRGKKILKIVAPMRIQPGFDGIVSLCFERGRADEILGKSKWRVFMSMVFMVLISLISMWLLYKNQNRHLAGIQEMEMRLHQAERLSALGSLAAGVAHEIRNPLNALSMAAQRLQESNLKQLKGVILEEIRRLNNIVEEFLGFSRSRRLKFSRLDLTGLLDQMVLLVREEAESEGISIETRYAVSPLMISMDSDKLTQAFLNIIKNAMESIHTAGAIKISVAPRGKEWVVVKISDTGIGLSSEEIERVFDPDYTTKEKGLGLGLSLAHEIIQGHAGEIHIQSQPGSGTTFEILMPVKNRADS